MQPVALRLDQKIRQDRNRRLPLHHALRRGQLLHQLSPAYRYLHRCPLCCRPFHFFHDRHPPTSPLLLCQPVRPSLAPIYNTLPAAQKPSCPLPLIVFMFSLTACVENPSLCLKTVAQSRRTCISDADLCNNLSDPMHRPIMKITVCKPATRLLRSLCVSFLITSRTNRSSRWKSGNSSHPPPVTPLGSGAGFLNPGCGFLDPWKTFSKTLPTTPLSHVFNSPNQNSCAKLACCVSIASKPA